MTAAQTLPNFIGGTWSWSEDVESIGVTNPATGEILVRAPMSGASEVATAAASAAKAFRSWRRTPAPDRIQFLFAYKTLLEENLEAIARTITLECGKTLAESRGELRRGIENVEVACGIPSLMQGCNNEDIARGIDEHMIRQPLGVVCAITPFNFPGMIPLWFLPYAIATGNCFIIKPSEKVPQTSDWLVRLLAQTGLPDGVVQLIHGGKDAVDALVEHPAVRAVSFVGSTPVARYVYAKSAAHGKRAQCQGGAKNTVVILPDANMDMATRIVADSAFGCAGQRCLANSLAVTVGEARNSFCETMADTASSRRVGFGLDEGVQMGPVITGASKARIHRLVGMAEKEGVNVVVDGRDRSVAGFDGGNWVFPTLLDGLPPDGDIANTEIFGPVFGLLHVDSLSDAIRYINGKAYGNMACLFTESGAAARQFRYEVEAGNVGINLGVAAPMAFFPFSGWKDSFFGTLHAQGKHAIEFYTRTKVVVERWPHEWSRVF